MATLPRLYAQHYVPFLFADIHSPGKHCSGYVFVKLNQSAEGLIRPEGLIRSQASAQSSYTCKNEGPHGGSAKFLVARSWNSPAETSALSPRVVRACETGSFSVKTLKQMVVTAASCSRDWIGVNRNSVFQENGLFCDFSKEVCLGLGGIKHQGLSCSDVVSLTSGKHKQIRHSGTARSNFALNLLKGGRHGTIDSTFRRLGARKALMFRVDRNAGDTSHVQGKGTGKILQLRMALYDDFVQFSVDKVGQHAKLSPVIGKNDYDRIVALDGKTVIRSLAYRSEKIRLFRIATIDGGDAMQVLNVAIFSESRYDLPIFCADFFSTSKANICVLDLNPLYTTEQNKDYKEKYFTSILPMAKNYIKLLPWGGKLTAESLQFFSPIVLWTKPHRSADVQEILFSAFQDYLLAWLSLLEVAVEAPDKVVLAQNQEAQHRYLMWRATKDPGRPVLTKLIGDVACEKYIKEFLFSGLESLGTKKFLDYFPEYKGDDGSLSTLRSVAGRSYAKRPWGEDGKFIQSLEI